ncbi:hypothetical protein VDG1235_3619 [Verrucomicrobiia bacterium DG1235]|nr:hypothetical protein VDG1235_3619 [Verrucomicrobiae bacterium DG1235]
MVVAAGAEASEAEIVLVAAATVVVAAVATDVAVAEAIVAEAVTDVAAEIVVAVATKTATKLLIVFKFLGPALFGAGPFFAFGRVCCPL